MAGVSATTIDSGPRRVDVPGTADTVDLRTMGGRIAWARLRKKMTQAEVAKATQKSRATIVQYEKDNIRPPVEEVEKLATVLDVSPAFIAFAQQGIEGLSNAAEEVITIPEITEGKDGTYQSSVFAIPRKFFEGRNIAPDKARMFVLNHGEDEFRLSAGDRVLIDTSVKEIGRNHDLYLLNSPEGVAVIRREPNFLGGQKGQSLITTGRGVSQQIRTKDLDIVGAIVGNLSLSV